MEASFYGFEKDKIPGSHFTCTQYMQIGRELCRSLICCFDIKKEMEILDQPYESSLLSSKETFDSQFSHKFL